MFLTVITDGIYANLIANDVQDIITSLGKQTIPLIEGQLTKNQITAKITELLYLLNRS
jgi:hypothetical protein